ncbi:hypothetical protein [Caballeronia sp. RCC_10]|uniref:hypothetical protein n=1 Tax=Caballeronia sp. RCC_10 TaxID=3239227 RepID=UPI00352347DB
MPDAHARTPNLAATVLAVHDRIVSAALVAVRAISLRGAVLRDDEARSRRCNSDVEYVRSGVAICHGDADVDGYTRVAWGNRHLLIAAYHER